jgi:integrating conjugative element protein (TIGR03759 family)
VSIAASYTSTCVRPVTVAALVLLLVPLSGTVAQDDRRVESRIAENDLRSSTTAELNVRLARDWGLDTEEWSRYRLLMQGPLGVSSPNLDPFTALGIEARTEEERRRYAELQVQFERQRVQKLLAYQRAYDEAWKRLYPAALRIAPSLPSPSPKSSQQRASPIERRLAVFVSNDCVACEERVKQLQAAGKTFDIYVVGSEDDDASIRKWAARAGVDAAKVRTGVITLNHDAGRWAWIGGRGEFPAVVQEVDGRWQRH